MKYFGSAGHWLVATGSYASSALEWLSVKAVAARLNTPPREMSLNIVASGNVFNVNDVRIVGNDKNYNNELLVFKKTSDSTYYVYASVDSASTWTFDITHRNSTIDEDGSTFVAGTLDTTDLTAVSNTATDVSFSYIDGNVGVGTAEPQANLDVVTSSTSSDVVMRIDASSITNTGYSEILMNGPGGNNQQLSIFCNGSGRTAGGGANATTIRNNIGPIILGRSSYETRLINPVDTTFVAGMWTQTINSTTVTTTIKKNIGSCMTTKTPDGYGSASGFSGSAGVFVAPFDGLYQFQCVCFGQGTGSNLLLVFNANGPSVTNNTWDTRNVISDYHEVIDLRTITNQEEPHGFSVLLDMKQDDAVDVQNHSTGYLGGDLLRCSCFLVHRL
jgi:hypothetical protein